MPKPWRMRSSGRKNLSARYRAGERINGKKRVRSESQNIGKG